MNKNLFIIPVLILIFTSCLRNSDSKNKIEDISEEEFKANFSQSARDIFYNMYLPCELVEIIRDDSIPFKPELLNKLENISNYSSSNKKALNLGVYGIDLGYLRIHNIDVSKDYYSSIFRLAKELGIPNDHVNKVLQYIEEGPETDSLYSVTCDLFEITDDYLSENNRQSTAALIILGGWIETMYIISSIDDDTPETKIMESIARQKYSLNSMVSFLTLCQDDPMVMRYLLNLNELQDIFDSIDIYFASEKDIEIDTLNKDINTDNAIIDISKEEFLEIKLIVSKVREHIVQ